MANTWSVKGVPFSRETFFQATDEWLYVGDGTTYDIQAYDRSGSLKRIIRVRQPPRSVTAAIIDRSRRAQSRIYSPRGPRVDPKVPSALFPKWMPAYAAFRVDGAQRLWVQEYPAPGDRQARWNVFDRSGALIATAVTPIDVEVVSIDTAHLIAIWRDEFDVEYLRIYSLALH
jgi:hypothetical protein